MNQGLVLLAAWGQWVAIVAVLVGLVARGAQREPTGPPAARYRRPSGDDEAVRGPAAPGGARRPPTR